MTELARTHPRLLELNCGSLLDRRVEVVNEDATTFHSPRPLDLILADLPDPTNPVLARLYTREFYSHLRNQLASEESLLAAQVVYVPPLFDGVLNTLRSVFPAVKEYAVWMYSFLRAGFALGGADPLERCRELPGGARHLTPESLEQLFYFAPDEPRVEVEGIATEENESVTRWYERYLEDYFEERILYY